MCVCWNVLTDFGMTSLCLGFMNVCAAFFRLLATDRRDEVRHDEVAGCIYTAIGCNSSKSNLLRQFFLRHVRHTTFRYYLGLSCSFLNYVFIIRFLDTFQLV